GVTVPDGHGIVLQRLAIDRDREGRTGLVLPAVAPPDRAAVVVGRRDPGLTEPTVDTLGDLRHPVLPDQRQDRRLDRREFRIEREDDAPLALDLLLAVRIGEDDEDGPVRAGRRLDDVRNIAMVRVCWIDVLETLPRVLLVPPQIEVRPVVDPLDLVPAEREFVLDVEGALRVVRELLRRVLVEAQPLPADAERDDPLHAASLPVLEPLLVRARLDEELHLHLLELAGPEDEVARRDLVAERLADLRDPERHALAGRRQDVLEVDEDPLRRLRPEVDGG